MAAQGSLPTASLKGKSALVTGGGRGIGHAISLQLARKGISSIAITYVGSKSTADETAAECLKLGAGKAIAVKADLLDPEIGSELIPKVLSGLEIEKLDVIINNAALVDMTLNEPFKQTTAKGFGTVMQGNCFAPMSVVRSALPHLPARGGRIINISSIASRDAPPDPLMTYGASKAALESFTRSLAMAYGKEHLATFNSVSVGATKTESMKNAIEGNFFPKEFVDKIMDRSSAEYRIGEPEDVAMIVAWLASEESRWINGASIMANGGDKAMIPVQG